MALHPYLAKALLDWLTGAAAVTQPGARWIEFATNTPTSQSNFAAPVQSRLTWNAAATNSAQGSATNRSAGTASFATAICTIVAWNLYDASTANATRLAWGTFTSNIACASGDAPAFAAGALKITLL